MLNYLKTFYQKKQKLFQVLKAQNKIRSNKQLPDDIKNIELISQAELNEIRRIWFYEKFEIDDAVPAICEKFAKGQYQFEDLEDNHVFDQEILKILKDTCQNDEMMFEITKGLLETERKHFKSARRTGLFDEFENIFKKSFFKDKTDAIDYAKEKKRIKESSEKQLPLTGTE